MSFIVDGILYLWNLFTLWANTLFIFPFKNTEMLWVLVPLWLSWFFSEFFQEKLGTSFGNAISNAIIVLWGGIDSIRQTVSAMAYDRMLSQQDITIRFIICGFMIVYGILIIIFGTRLNKKVKYFGRIRDVTYVFVIFIPILYGAVAFSWDHIIAAVLFFPLFYYAIELIDYITPDPRAVDEDIKEAEQPRQPESSQKRPPQNPKGPSQPPSNQPVNPPSSVSYWSEG